MPYEITQCYLPPAEVTFPPLPQPKLVLDLATPEGCKAELFHLCVFRRSCYLDHDGRCALLTDGFGFKSHHYVVLLRMHCLEIIFTSSDS